MEVERLKSEIKLHPNTIAEVKPHNYFFRYACEVVNISIEIGEYHTANLIMPKESWEALKNGEDVFTVDY